jgi:hypothetical protein
MEDVNRLGRLEQKWEDTIALLNKMTLETATQSEKMNSIVNLMAEKMNNIMNIMSERDAQQNTFMETVTKILAKQDTKIDDQDKKLENLSSSKEKLLYDNGKLFSDQGWMRKIFGAGTGIFLALYGVLASEVVRQRGETNELTDRVLEIKRGIKQ